MGNGWAGARAKDFDDAPMDRSSNLNNSCVGCAYHSVKKCGAGLRMVLEVVAEKIDQIARRKTVNNK
jgi:hypothetical protein